MTEQKSINVRGYIDINGNSFGRLDMVGSYTILPTYTLISEYTDINGNVNYFKLEDISNDFSPVSNLIGIDIPQLNSINVNPAEVDYDELLTEDLKIIIRELFNKDFESFSY